ncbi:MAG TPA: TIR domain-containing protein [Sphingomicrobium sp.]
MSGPDIFISYSREDRSAARHFAACFTRAGFNVWWDAALRSGETFDEVIEKELRAAKAVVVLWSPRSVASRWVRAEATLADRFNKLVPVIIEACNLPIIFELTHAADLADWTGDEADSRWETLIDDLRRLVGDGEPAVQPAPPQSAKAPKLVAVPAPASAEPASDNRDELIAALERLSKARSSELSRPTPQEEEQAEFLKRSDEYRMQEGAMVHSLQRLDGEEQVTRFTVTPAGLRIGRTPPADIIVPGMGVSRAHCLVELSGDTVRVTDLNSTNGTYIDNKRIMRSETLEVGSILRVGNVSFEHEVRKRSVMDQPGAPDDIHAGPVTPEARLAGSS